MQKVIQKRWMLALTGVMTLAIISSVAVIPSVSARDGADDGTTSTERTGSNSGKTQTSTVKVEDDGTVETETETHATSGRTTENRTTELHQKTEAAKEAKEAAKTKLADAKLRVCKTHEKVIDTIMSNAAARGDKQMGVIDTIATRTEAFYQSKGKTLANYDELVAKVNAAKATAQTAVDTVKNSSTTFNCDGTDPKGVAAGFKNSVRAEVTALKEYRTAVKNLIVGVKSVQVSTSTEGERSNDQ